MKRLIAIMALFLFLVAPVMTYADYDDEPVDIVVLELLEPSQQKAPIFTPTPRNYDWDDKLVDELASIFWAETGKDRYVETEKLCITQLIFNRVNYGAPFAESLYGVMKQKGEFNHGKVSDRNREKAREYLDLCQSQQDGYFQGISLPKSAIYMGRTTGGELEFYDENFVAVYKVSRGF